MEQQVLLKLDTVDQDVGEAMINTRHTVEQQEGE